jgi:hypothetical protein
VKPLSALSLLALALQISGCATPSPQSALACPQLPSMPSASQSQPSQPYSQTAQDDIKRWQSDLTGTRPM